ncbi:MAG: metallophosphoesterase [Gemmatimonadales bacterium]
MRDVERTRARHGLRARELTRGIARRSWWLVALPLLAFSCDSDDRATPLPPADAPAVEIALADAVVMIGAGDIAMCNSRGDEATAAIVDSILREDTAAKVKDVVVTMGDNAYTVGSANQFARCFGPSWGSKRIMQAIRPSPGNHDYDTRDAIPYFNYFGDRAGPRGKGYYSYDLGDWHILSLNSETIVDRPGTPEPAEQLEWLREDLKNHGKPCTLAYFHRPLFSSGVHGPTPEVMVLWTFLDEGGVDLILNGHDHHYERFLPQTPLGVADSVKGIEQIIVGTGGGDLRRVNTPLANNSAFEVHGRFGVLKLTLGDGEYRRAFIDTNGTVWDRGGRRCH